MRLAFATTLAEIAASDRRVVLLTADLGYMALEPFAEKYPDRFFNVGVAEQNMVGLATGLAEAGFIPFIYSIATFATLRPYEFIRNGPVQHQLPVRIIGVGGGFEYATNGLSHYGLEDVAVMRAQPGIRIIVPADHARLRASLIESWNHPGPIYFRLGKDDKTVVPNSGGSCSPAGIEILRNGDDLALVVMGPIVNEVLNAAQILEQNGISAKVVLLSEFNPDVQACLLEAIEGLPIAYTIEAHYISGGLGSFVAETLTENCSPCRLVRCGVPWDKLGVTGSQRYLEERFGLSGAALSERIRLAFKGTNEKWIPDWP